MLRATTACTFLTSQLPKVVRDRQFLTLLTSKCVATWAVVSATHRAVLSSGPVPGLQQNVDRAELIAAFAAVNWTWEQGVSAVLWTDSAYVVTGLAAILDAGSAVEHDTNEDLWGDITERLLVMPAGSFRVQHVASHRDPALQESDFHAWTAQWNGWADRQARRALRSLPAAFLECQKALEESFFASERLVDLFCAFHLDFAQQNVPHNDIEGSIDDGESLQPPALQRPIVAGGDWIDGLPLAWHAQWQQSDWSRVFPLAVLQRMVDWLQNERVSAVDSHSISWLELTAMLEVTNFVHPVLTSDGAQNFWEDPFRISAHLHRPLTVAARIRFLRDLFRALDGCFELDIPFVNKLNLASFKIHPPQNGIIMLLSSSTMRAGANLLSSFTLHRPIRTSNDLARPL